MEPSSFDIQRDTPAYPQRKPLVDGIIPEQSFTLIFQCIQEWLESETFLGYSCTRTPRFHYIAFDRPLAATFDHLRALGISYIDTQGNVWVTLQSAALEDYSKKDFRMPPTNPGDIVILDGLDMLTQSGSIKDFKAVNDICRQCLNVIETLGVSVIGMIGAIKSNGKKEEGHPMDRLLGSGVWQRISDTNMLIELANPHEIENPDRILYIRPRLRNPVRLFFTFKDSRLVKSMDPKNIKGPEGFYYALPDGRIFTSQEAIQIGQMNNISRATVYRLIDYIVDEKKWIVKLSTGKFKKVFKPN